MSEYSALKATINANVKANNNQEITGTIMNSVLNAMVNALGAGYQLIGVATPTNPGTAQTPDYKCFYLATTPGTYTYLGGVVVTDGEVALLMWDTAWHKVVTGIASADKLNQLGQKVYPLSADIESVIPLSQGAISSTGEFLNLAYRALSGFIDAPFQIAVNNGFVAYTLARYTKSIDGTYTFYDSTSVPAGGIVTDENYVYRITFCKSDYASNILPSEYASIISTFIGKVDYISTKINGIKNTAEYLYPWRGLNSVICWQFAYIYKYTNGYECKLIPVVGGENLLIKANATSTFFFTFVKSFITPETGVEYPYDFATGETQRRDVSAGNTASFVVPSDARFIICSYKLNNADATPEILTINGYDLLGRKELEQIQTTNRNAISFLKISTKSELHFMRGAIDSSGQYLDVASRAVTDGFIDGAFQIKATNGFVVYTIARYSRSISGEYTWVDTISAPADGIIHDETMSYRVTVCKTDYVSIIQESEYATMIDEFAAGIIYNSERIKSVEETNIGYGFVKSILNAEKEGEIIPYTRGVISGASIYDTSKEYERLNLLFMTDSHIDLGNVDASVENVKDAIAFANNLHTPISAILEGGDVVTRIPSTKQEGMQDLERFFNMAWQANMPLLYTKGNHDLNAINVPPSEMFDDDDWGDIWFDRAESQYGIVRNTKSNGKKSGYYYYDLASWKVRIVSLDCFDVDYSKVDGQGNILYWGGTSYYFSQEQMTWVINNALNFDDKDEKDWGVLFMTHNYRATDPYGTDIEPRFAAIYPVFNSMVKAFNDSDVWSHQYTFADDNWFDLNLSADWTRYANLEKKPYLIGIISGHMHWDSNEVVDGVNNIRTANQCCGEPAADIKVKRVAGTTTQNLFDIVNIDLKEKKIRYIRYGAGKNCFGVGGSRFLPDGLSF